MSKEKRRVPKLRFPGFTEDWEQRKLGEIGKWYKGIGGTKDDLNTKRSGRMFVHYADLYQTSEFLTTVVHWTTNENIGSLITPNSILFPMSDVTPYGLARTTSCKINEVRAGGDVLINTIDKSIDSNFVSIYINLFSKNILPFVIGTTVKHINSKALSELTILIPSFEEQLKIVNVVNFYNKVITLHQRKLEHLNLKKKALLQKLFPKNGERYPELRFPGFTDAWEQRKLGDIATFSKGNGYSKSDLAPSGVPIILYGRLYTNYETTISNIDTFVELKDKSIISQGGEVIVPASGETAEDISRASVVKKQGIIIGGDLNVIKANHLLDPTFLALTISNGEQQKELSKRAQGKSVVHLNNSDLQEVNLTFPVLNEQKEISTLFEKMDNFITLHQRKLDHLQLQKKALLQQMFV